MSLMFGKQHSLLASEVVEVGDDEAWDRPCSLAMIYFIVSQSCSS